MDPSILSVEFHLLQKLGCACNLCTKLLNTISIVVFAHVAPRPEDLPGGWVRYPAACDPPGSPPPLPPPPGSDGRRMTCARAAIRQQTKEEKHRSKILL